MLHSSILSRLAICLLKREWKGKVEAGIEGVMRNLQGEKKKDNDEIQQ
jgi:hypothetical protein